MPRLLIAILCLAAGTLAPKAEPANTPRQINEAASRFAPGVEWRSAGETSVRMDDIPGPAVALVKEYIRTLVPTDSRKSIRETGETVYVLEGRANGRAYRIEVNAEGSHISIGDGSGP